MSEPLIQACIFDLDGVLVDTAHYHFLAWRRLANQIGIDLTEEINEKLKGVSRMHSLEIILQTGGVSLNEEEKVILATKKNQWFNEYIEAMSSNEIFPGVIDLIQTLRDANLKIGLASSSKNAHRIIAILNVAHLFDAMVDGTMITHTKPHPEIFLLAAAKLQASPKNCLVFEDAEAGVEAAIAAGMYSIGVGSEQQLGKANKVLARTADFKLEMVKNFN